MNRNANTKSFKHTYTYKQSESFKTGVYYCLKKKEHLIGHGKLEFKRSFIFPNV